MPLEVICYRACSRGERMISEAEYRELQRFREAAENVDGNLIQALLQAQTEKVSAA